MNLSDLAQRIRELKPRNPLDESRQAGYNLAKRDILELIDGAIVEEDVTRNIKMRQENLHELKYYWKTYKDQPFKLGCPPSSEPELASLVKSCMMEYKLKLSSLETGMKKHHIYQITEKGKRWLKSNGVEV